MAASAFASDSKGAAIGMAIDGRRNNAGGLLLVVACCSFASALASETPPQKCDIIRMAQQCQLHRPPKLEVQGTRESYCHNSCVVEMMLCSNDSRLLLILRTAERVTTFKEMAQVCTVKQGVAGDGSCDVLDIAKYHEQLDQLHQVPSCTSQMTKELFDCKDDPMMSSQRAEILRMQKACASPNKPGDGRCTVMAIAIYKKEPGDTERGCRSKTIQEMIDCIDDPMMANQRSAIARFKAHCPVVNPASKSGGH